MRLATVLLALSMLAAACSTDSAEDLPDPVPLYTQSIGTVSPGPGAVTFTVINTTPQPCYRYFDNQTETTGDTVEVVVYGQRTTNGVCIDVIGSIQTDLTIPVESGRDYLFRFWQSDEATLDTLVTMP